MSTNGLLAFCTFYEGFQDDFEKLGSEKSGFDFVYGKGTSILTKLRFRLKPQAKELNKDLVEQFDVTLFPNSVYIMSLLANRWYTHEIVPSALNVEKVRTSKKKKKEKDCSILIFLPKDSNSSWLRYSLLR